MTILALTISSISFLKSIITSLMPSIQTDNTIRLLMRSSLSNTTLSMSCPRWTSKGFYVKVMLPQGQMADSPEQVTKIEARLAFFFLGVERACTMMIRKMRTKRHHC